MAKEKKYFFVEIDEDGDVTGMVYTSEIDVKENACAGEIFIKVPATGEKFKLVDESVKLVKIK